MDITTYNIYSKLFHLLYADDTVIIAENQSELQKTLENLHEYCITNELTISTTKTRVMVCSRGKIRNKPTFTYGVNKLEIVFEYMYLGVKVTYNGKFKDHMEYASLKGTKSMFALLQKANMLNMPVDIQCHLFGTLVSPVLLCWCEVWGSNDISIIDKIHLKFMKYILHVNKSTSSNMIYRELGRMPLHITVTHVLGTNC